MTVTIPTPFAFGRVRVQTSVTEPAPDLSDPAVVAALLDDARRVAREESGRRRRLAGLRRRTA